MSSKQTSQTDPTVANRYLAHQLSDAERVMQEAELMVNPAAVQELEATARLKIGLHRLRESGELEALLTPPTRRIRVPVMMALAASVVAVALLLGRMILAPSPQLLTTVGQRPAASVATSYLVTLLRGQTPETVIVSPPPGKVVRLNILPSTVFSPPFRVVLQEQAGGKTLGEITVPAADSKYVSVLLDFEQLQPGSYQLTLSSLAASAGAKEEFVLRIGAAAAPAPASRQ